MTPALASLSEMPAPPTLLNPPSALYFLLSIYHLLTYIFLSYLIYFLALPLGQGFLSESFIPTPNTVPGPQKLHKHVLKEY